MATKDTGYRIRVEKALRDEFISACRSQDIPAAQIIREFMRDYVQKHRPVYQRSLFPSEIETDT
jgi:hypothetical protein